MGEQTLQVTLMRKHAEAEAIVSFDLSAREGDELPAFEAGSHIDVHLPNGLVRQYSLYGNPADNSAYRLAVLKEPQSRGGSEAVHELLQVGDVLTISRPRNNFKLVEEAGSTLLIAGGIGITPLLSMAHRLAGLGRNFQLHYCGRSPERMAFHELLKDGALSGNSNLYLDSEGPAFDPKQLFSNQPKDTHIYVCGPAGFIDWVIKEAQAADIAPAQLHQEFFSRSEAAPAGEEFTVVLNRSGKSFVIPDGETVTEALAKEGIEIPVSCEQGICGTCVTKVIDGIPDHRDSYLTDEEKAANDQFMPCCSRASSPKLVLDL
ncbi:oxidoreductase [Burkholderia sp. SRS-W-2-2016]|uniref:PDR/VanB family oxidoreductase n=1 Tax=Burkholderia sp. SRS-W-2-2016 TaxID=1926878 RepID=UPI00094B05FF|nr:PDR/VanB family oxidoreductase [Burkholderia sp. SRS-W-2-2016]OLL31690.1 oxidoreductase [Burkholderia sp. SRS-W-2-2016]